jgi:kumamolisin
MLVVPSYLCASDDNVTAAQGATRAQTSPPSAGPWWQRADPLTLAVLGAILTLLGNIAVGFFNHRASIEQARMKAADDLALERTKAKFNLILQAIATNDPKIAARNIDFFIGAGLLEDSEGRIRRALTQFNPVLPSASGAKQSSSKPILPSELSRIYGFPAGLTGSGQVVGMLEFGGGYRRKDLDKHFAAQGLATPSIVDVSVAGAKNTRGSAADGQVESDIQIVAAIAPEAELRVYFAPYTKQGWLSAIQQVVADEVSVLLIAWGSAESLWNAAEIDVVNDALKHAAMIGITVVCAAGDSGTTDGATEDGRRHVTFPASSPWVTAVGGTSLESKAGQLVSEMVWNDRTAATGGGVSDHFDQPEWQSAIKVPPRANGSAGRGIPDVAATAWNTLLLINIGGQQARIGGTSVSAAIWAALIARINEGLGKNVGYLNPRLYREIGPSHVLRPILKGHNGLKGSQGYSAGPGWNPVAGWGSPDGEKLLAWLTEHEG